MTKKTPPFSLRLTFEERARLEQLTGDMPLGSYIKKKVFDGKGLKGRRAAPGNEGPSRMNRSSLTYWLFLANHGLPTISINSPSLPISGLCRSCQKPSGIFAAPVLMWP
tara:strand:+ start:78 stop:404 length:327 start_codon:yes stop_codon:yes gene_type:complete